MKCVVGEVSDTTRTNSHSRSNCSRCLWRVNSGGASPRKYCNSRCFSKLEVTAEDAVPSSGHHNADNADIGAKSLGRDTPMRHLTVISGSPELVADAAVGAVALLVLLLCWLDDVAANAARASAATRSGSVIKVAPKCPASDTFSLGHPQLMLTSYRFRSRRRMVDGSSQTVSRCRTVKILATHAPTTHQHMHLSLIHI